MMIESLEEIKGENEKLKGKNEHILKKQLPEILKQCHQVSGLNTVREYVPRLLNEWNVILIQKNELLIHICRHLDRNRAFNVMLSFMTLLGVRVRRYWLDLK